MSEAEIQKYLKNPVNAISAEDVSNLFKISKSKAESEILKFASCKENLIN